MFLQVLVCLLVAVGVSRAAVKGHQNFNYYQQPRAQLRGDTLKQVHIIFRHGDRAPIGTYPNDPNKNFDWPYGRAQLTEIGKRQQYETGSFLRNRYGHVLTTDPREVFVRSSDIDRCLASVQTNLAAFYKPEGKWLWNQEHLPWQPMPIHTAPAESDWLLNEDSKCPAAEEIKKNIMKTPEGIRYAQKYQRLFDYVSKQSGKPVNDPSSVLSVHGITYINKLYEREYGLVIPSWVDHVWDEFTRAADEAFVVGYSPKPYLRLRGGPLVGHITKLMKSYDDQDHKIVQPKVFIYSTHDAIIAAFLNAVGVFNGRQIPYAGTVMVELHEHDRPINQYTVRMYYRNTTLSEPFPLTVPGCQTDCPLTDFQDLLKDIVPADIRTECYGPHNEQHQRQEFLPTNQGCCCNQYGSAGLVSERVRHDDVAHGSPLSVMQELTARMDQAIEQQRKTVLASMEELIRSMEQQNQAVEHARHRSQEVSERLSHQTDGIKRG